MKEVLVWLLLTMNNGTEIRSTYRMSVDACHRLGVISLQKQGVFSYTCTIYNK